VLISEGPNAKRDDDVLKALPVLPSARIYVDNYKSYSGNEPDINIQAAFVFLLTGALEDQP
jgi:hypothetical protein